MKTDAEIIQSLGGPAAVARLLKLRDKGGRQRVHNWIKRGIPARVKLEFPRVFLSKRASK